MRITILLVCVICCVLIQEVQGARLQNCDYCVKVLQCVYGQMGKSVRSKRLLESKLTHTCKRYPEFNSFCPTYQLIRFSIKEAVWHSPKLTFPKFSMTCNQKNTIHIERAEKLSVNEQEGRSVEALNLSGEVSILTFLFMVFIFLHLPLYFLSQ
ncbi:hypothetical protein B9Z55_023136 [Caenorhabditis nigoni]|uniref:Saposin B-type domain-containing protein n=1 Tax=Caenorhabditis nigoni TaxID=1611254 RepID=A0A2G5SNH6_9PELO|nr:hypothetical protein B9Z55_023136 [Caenorhabditis nigoni]